VSSLETAPVDSVDTERKGWSSAKERWAEQRRLVCLVATAYRSVCDLEPVVAFNPDPETRGRSNRWSPDSCHYKVDVENTVRRVILSKPEVERPELWAAWSNLVTDGSKIGVAEQRLIRLLYGVVYTKKLHPGIYFRPSRPARKAR